MSDQPETYQRVSVPEAAQMLGLSVATVRRRIRDGSLQAERVQRPQGIAYAVLLPIDHGTDHDRPTTDHQVGTTARLNQSGPPAAEAITAMLQATLTPIIGPLVVELAAVRQVSEARADQLVQQAEVIGRVTAERDAAVAAHASILAAQSTPASSEPAVPVWRRIWPLLLVAAGAVLLMLLVWPR